MFVVLQIFWILFLVEQIIFNKEFYLKKKKTQTFVDCWRQKLTAWKKNKGNASRYQCFTDVFLFDEQFWNKMKQPKHRSNTEKKKTL